MLRQRRGRFKKTRLELLRSVVGGRADESQAERGLAGFAGEQQQSCLPLAN